MVGTVISPGDIVLSPGGNARYGGLLIEVGVVIRLTERRVRVVSTKIIAQDKHTFKASGRGPNKLLVVTDPAITLLPIIHILREKALLEAK